MKQDALLTAKHQNKSKLANVNQPQHHFAYLTVEKIADGLSVDFIARQGFGLATTNFR